MDAIMPSRVSIPASILQPLFFASNSSSLDKTLENLIQTARTADGRRDLASKDILTSVLQLCQYLSCASCGQTLSLSFKLLRNLCAGELRNQNSFIEQNGVEIVSNILSSKGISTDLIRLGLQVLANVSLAGKEHQVAISHQLYSLNFVEIARLRSRDTCDPLCMIIYTCVDGSYELMEKLGSDDGLLILLEIIRTASTVGFGEDWLKLLLSKACVEESYFACLFSKLQCTPADNSDILPQVNIFTKDRLFLLSILSEILNEQIEHIAVSKDFALDVLQLFESALRAVDFVSRAKSGLPTGSTDIDALGYSLSILRDICACDSLGGFKEGSLDIVDSLLSSGLLEILLDLLRDLEPPALIRKAMKVGENQDGETSYSGKLCPYKGFRSDIVGVIGNCAYSRKHVQDEIRERNGFLLMLQQCVTDEENPFLREWGIWAVRNLLEGNIENQRLVSELEVQGSVDLPELAGLGLRVEVDQQTRRAKLVSGDGLLSNEIALDAEEASDEKLYATFLGDVIKL